MKSSISVCFIMLCLATVPGFGASSGEIDCQEKSSVTALDGPNSIVAVRQLYCNQTVSPIGMEQGYVKIQIDEHLVGFVEARHVRMTENSAISEPWIQAESGVKPDSQTRTSASSDHTSYSMIDPVTGEVRAPQSTGSTSSTYRGYPKFEIFAGYGLQKTDGYPVDELVDYLKEDSLLFGNVLTHSRYLKKGFAGSFTYNFTPHLGLEAAVRYSVGNILGQSGYEYDPYDYSEYSFAEEFKRSDLSILVGPRFAFRNSGRLTPFVHALAGYSEDKVSYYYEMQNEEGDFFSDNMDIRTSKSFGALAGGGLDFSISDSWAVRLVQADYYVSRHGNNPFMEFFAADSDWNILSGPDDKKLFKNITISSGVVFKF